MDLRARHQKESTPCVSARTVCADIVAHGIHDERRAAEFVEREQAGLRRGADDGERRLTGSLTPDSGSAPRMLLSSALNNAVCLMKSVVTADPISAAVDA